MAGERIGRVYEGLVFVSAKTALAMKRKSTPVTWNASESNLMAQPDVCLGDPTAPEAIVLITRSGARRGWDKKFWRNVGEIIDIRSYYPTARIINISLGTEIKEELMEALSLIVDVDIFPQREVREELEVWVQSIEEDSPTQQEELSGFLQARIEEAPPSIKTFIHSLGMSITSSSDAVNTSWVKVNSWLVKRRQTANISSKEWKPGGSIRRGLAKLLTFGEPKDVLSEIDKKLRLAPVLAASLARFGWASKSITGWRLSDPEMISVLVSFDRKTIIQILERSTSEELRAMCADIASDEWITATCEYLLSNRGKFSDAMWLCKQLNISLRDSSMGNKIHALPPSGIKGNWLFRVLIALIKLSSGLKQGYGYEQMIGDIRAVAKDDELTSHIIRAGGSLDQIRRAGTTDSLRRKLVDWVSGLRAVDLVEWQVLLISSILSRRLVQIKPNQLVDACEELPAFMRRLTYEDRIAPYRFFEPLRSIIELALERASIVYEYYPRFNTLISEASSSARSPGTTAVICAGSTIIHWKSAHGSHTSDKTKELCGRGFCIRHRLDEISQTPIHISDIRQLLLVLDGDFDTVDVEHLLVTGWDFVFRPDEIDKLVDAVRKVV
jgi:hypothetical protein